jgi:hypothetical protein
VTLLAISLVLAAVAAAWVVVPLFARRTARIGDAVPGRILDAEARRRVALASLKEVEYDYLAGKLDEEDYAALRDRLSLEAVQALDAAERVRGVPAAPAAAVTAAAMQRHACGFANPEGSRFCGGCGERLG